MQENPPKTLLQWVKNPKGAEAIIDWGIVDERGRRVGHALCINPEYKGEGFEFIPYSERNGQKFGAIPSRSIRVFKTVADAQQYAELWVRKARARILDTAMKNGWEIVPPIKEDK